MSRRTHFNLPARVLHWLMAAMILTMLFVGVGMVASVTQRPWLIDLHRPLGIAILILAMLRLINRLRNRPPPLPADLPAWQKAAAIASHWLLYALMLGSCQPNPVPRPSASTQLAATANTARRRCCRPRRIVAGVNATALISGIRPACAARSASASRFQPATRAA